MYKSGTLKYCKMSLAILDIKTEKGELQENMRQKSMLRKSALHIISIGVNFLHISNNNKIKYFPFQSFPFIMSILSF